MGAKAPKKYKVLFVCVGNMCRSQMAEGFARQIASDFVEPYSAGTNPAGQVSLDAIAVMDEMDIDISRQHSKGLDAVPVGEMDFVVTMGCCSADSICPLNYVGGKVDWEIEDPVGRPREVFLRVRDTIEGKVKKLLEEIWKEKDIKSEK
jgi:arsenate reductase (thioredoxin)